MTPLKTRQVTPTRAGKAAATQTTYIALLRAVNLGAHNKIAMRDLRDFVEALGMKDTQTVVQSGNLVFRSKAAATSGLEQLLEEAAEKRLGLRTDFFVRTAAEWKTLVGADPFPEAAKRDPGHLLVYFLKGAPGRAAVSALQKAIVGRETVAAKGEQAYIIYPDGVGRSRLSVGMIEKYLGTRATGRNWNTVLKLGTLAGVV